MSHHEIPSSYEALEQNQYALYNPDTNDPVPPSPSRFDNTELPPASPRFRGPALYTELSNGSTPELRQSLASAPSTRDSQFTSNSVYALNAESLSHRYLDDPSAPAHLPLRDDGYREEKRAIYTSAPSKRRRFWIWAIVLVILLIVAVVLGIYFGVIRPKSKSNSPSEGASSSSGPQAPSGSSSPGGDKPASRIVTGGDGSTVTLEDGTTFTYSNSFGGYWYYDEDDPFNNGAKAQDWTPALNETFTYGTDKIWGVNLGGWLVLEPFITPAPFEQYYPNAIDEWTLHTLMRADTANGGISQIEDHYKTFITEKDFAEIAGAGLNYVRIPLPYAAIEVRDGEPFLPKVAWTYFLKAIKWARKYGLRINLDLHTAPGSQNGWNHSGRQGAVNFLLGPMGYANAQRTTDYIRIISEFISQPQYRDVVTMFGILNEPRALGSDLIGQDSLGSFYLNVHQTVRLASGIGTGPWISYHDGFLDRDQWFGYFPSADRIAIDTHPYLCFHAQSTSPMSSYATTPCNQWGKLVNDSMAGFGLTVAGEWSNAVTDCALWLNGVDKGTRYEGNWTDDVNHQFPPVGDCTPWNDYSSWDDDTKADYVTFALASMDALQNWFFWTWKIGPSKITGKIESPQWSYQLGLEQGWMPKDPRASIGQCQNANPWQPPLSAGDGNIPQDIFDSHPWPPQNLVSAGVVSDLPQYTPTGVIPTLPPPTLTPTPTAPVDVGNGWNNLKDNLGMAVEIQGCTYLDPWIGPAASPPSPLCSS